MCCKLLKKQEKLLQKNVRFTIEKPIGGGGKGRWDVVFSRGDGPKKKVKKQRSEDYA